MRKKHSGGKKGKRADNNASSAIDDGLSVASGHGTEARDAMLLRTHTAIAPWRIVHTDNKRLARLNLMRDILSRLHYTGKKAKLVQPDPGIAFEFTPDCLDAERLAR